jgi:hypothetical protein
MDKAREVKNWNHFKGCLEIWRDGKAELKQNAEGASKNRIFLTPKINTEHIGCIPQFVHFFLKISSFGCNFFAVDSLLR